MASLTGEFLSSRAEMHSAQDGVLVAILLWIPMFDLRSAAVLYSVLGLSLTVSNGSVKLKKFVEVVDERIRLQQIRNNPEYFAIPFTAVSIVLFALGYALGVVDPSVLAF